MTKVDKKLTKQVPGKTAPPCFDAPKESTISACKSHASPQSILQNDLRPALTIENVLIEKLTPMPRNVRRAEKDQIDRVVGSIERFGFVTPVLIGGDGEIVDGNIQVEAARRRGLDRVPCIRVDHLSATSLRQLRITLNKIQERGAWDFAELRLEFEDFLTIDTDLGFTGFETAEIDQMLELGSGIIEDPSDGVEIPPDIQGAAVSKHGDLWRLGDHRLLCGDARSLRDLQKLCGENLVQMLYTDPPYNVPVAGHVRSKGPNQYREFAMAVGEMTRAEFTSFLARAFDNATQVTRPGSLFYVFMDWRHAREIIDALEGAKLRLVNLCVWVKPQGGMGSLYRSRHELIFVSAFGADRYRNNVQLGKFGRNRTNVWEYAGATGGRCLPEDDFSVHPTVKPIQMAEDAILDSTAIHDVVLDLFLGSGSTLLAADRTKRRCFGLELDPAYVDLAIRRWQKMTGGTAYLDDNGTTFDELELASSTEKIGSGRQPQSGETLQD